jgi:hypothetical protein
MEMYVHGPGFCRRNRIDAARWEQLVSPNGRMVLGVRSDPGELN